MLQIKNAMRVYMSSLLDATWGFCINPNYWITLDSLSLWIDAPNINFITSFSDTDFSWSELLLHPSITWETPPNLILDEDTQIQIQYTSIWVIATLLVWEYKIDISGGL